MARQARLKRSLTLPVLALYGLGNILGAGIYVLVGKVAGEAGANAPLSFLIAMMVAALTAFSYMELSSRFPVSASVSIYLHKAFGHRRLATLVGLLIIASGIASAAALAQGFAGYFNNIAAFNSTLVSVAVLVILGLLAAKSIKESAGVAAALTLVEVAGLLLVIWAGRGALGAQNLDAFTQINPAVGFSGILGGAFLAFYAFIGFEDMVNVAEEVEKPRRNMPYAILIALITATVLYLLVVLVATALAPASELAASDSPLSLVFERTGSSHALVITTIGMVAAVNGIVVQLIMSSRILYGLSSQGWISNRFKEVNPETSTPVFATLITVTLMILGTILLPLVSLAQLTSLLVLIIFSMVHLALLRIQRTHKATNGVVKVPSIVPAFGLLTCLALIAYQVYVWL